LTAGVVDAPVEWDRFVRTHAAGNFCHLAAWRGVMERGLGHETVYLAATSEAGDWEGVLPLVSVRSRLFGRYLISMPFLNYGGPIGSQRAVLALTSRALAEARARGSDLLELRGRESLAAGLQESNRKVTVLLPLPDTSTELFQNRFPSKLRSQIRRAQKEKLETRFGPDQARAFYRVFCRTMRDLGTPVLPWAFFEQIAAGFRDESLFAAVYLGEEPIAAACGFLMNGEFEITWAGALREHNRKSPNMLLYWSLMERVIEVGAHTFNFGRCTPGSSTHRFKLQWGGADAPLPWSYWSSTGLASAPSPDRPLYRAATQAWARLPLPIANHLGPVLARQIP
jgi:FemAB-related protein (PEP-CTERM system-associated)